MATVDKLKPNDPRVERKSALINGKTYHYLLGNPPNQTGTIILVHGWPDLSLGWRYQVPYLLNTLRLRVIVPDMLGYGRSDSPQDLSAYSLKSVCADLAALAAEVTGSKTRQIILGGHDWGGAVVWRFALWYPHLLKAVFSLCTPFYPVRDGPYMDPETMVRRVLPNFAYQLQLAGPDVEANIVGRDRIRQFLRTLYDGRAEGPGGKREPGFTTERGAIFDVIDRVGPSPILPDGPDDLDFYVDEYMRHGTLRGPLNWYRTSKINYDEERELVKEGVDKHKTTRVSAPSMLIVASKDVALPPKMAAGMEAYFDSLVTHEVDADHWVHWRAPEQVNVLIGEFLKPFLNDSGVGRDSPKL